MTDPRLPQPRLENGKPNWIWVENEYRLGRLSIRNIATSAGVSDTAIRKRAKTNGWERDLTSDVRKEVRKKQFAVRTDDAGTREPRTDEELVQEAAAVALEVVRQHRGSIQKARDVVDVLLADLKAAAVDRAVLGEAIKQIAEAEADKAGSDDGATRHIEALGLHVEAALKAISLEGNARTVRSLASGLRDLITLERKALGLDDQESDADRPVDYVPLSDRLKRYDNADNVVPMKKAAGGD